MGIAQATSAVMVFLTGLLPAGCHKTASQPAEAPSVSAVSPTNGAAKFDPKNQNLGQICLTNRTETGLHLLTGEDCLFTPKILDRKSVQIDLSVEAKNDYGETRNFAVTQIITEAGKPVQVAVGDLKLTFIPLLSTNE